MPTKNSGNFWSGFAASLQRHCNALLLLVCLLSVASCYFSFHLYKNLRTDIEELLPESAPSVQDLKSAAHRFSGMNHIEVVIESSDFKAGERFQVDVGNRLRQLPSDLVAQVKESIREERGFFEKNRAYYVDLADWESVLAKAKEKLRAQSKKMFNLGLDDEEDAADSSKKLGLPIKELQKKYQSKSGTLDRFPDDYFRSPDGRTRVVLAFLSGKVTDMGGNRRLSEATEAIVRELDPLKYAPDMKVGLGGDVQNVVEENRELVKDLVLSFIVVTVLVTVVIWLYFHTLSAVTVLSVTLFAGVALAFGISYFTVGYLNANTAFLGSIVIGNGINFPIILLARYAELRRQKMDYLGALSLAMADTWKPTLAAALAAGVSYGSLALTDFRGFSQFGVIGAVGMATCWTAAYLLLPLLVVFFERRGWMHVSGQDSGTKTGLTAKFARLAVRHHKAFAIGTLLLSVAALWGAAHLSKATIESDLSKLRNKESMEHGSGFWGKKTDDIFGRGLTPTILLTEGPEQTAKLLKALEAVQAREKDNSPFASISVIGDVYPSDQKRKLEIMKELNRLLTPKVRESLSKEEASLVRDFLPTPPPPPFAMTDLPPALLKGYQETDGKVQTVLQVFPRLSTGDGAEAQGTWNGEEVIRYTALLREAIRSAGVHAFILGQNPISADMLEAIEKDGPKATLFAFVAVAVLVILMYPNLRQAAPMLLSLLLGVLWMVGAIGAFGWRINFLNFIALPITFGIGVDYSVNIFGRLFRDKAEGREPDVEQVIRETGGAVVLCSLTTSIGYGSLLLSGSQAFVSFGKLAVTGELTCLAAALLSLPSIWLLLSKSRKA